MIYAASKARSRKPAHVSKLSNKLIEKAIGLLLEGLPIDAVCDYLTITPHTYYMWKEKGEKYLLEENTPRGPEFPEDAAEARFLIAVSKARAEHQLSLVRRSFGDKNTPTWVRDMTILERRDRKNWGRNETIQVTDTASTPDEAYL